MTRQKQFYIMIVILEVFFCFYPEKALSLQQYNFKGSVYIHNCSGALIRFKNSRPSQNALIMTNAHCERPENLPHRKNYTKYFVLLDEKGEFIEGIPSLELIYGTRQGTDLAIYKMRNTYQELQNHFGIEAYTISEQSNIEGNNIEILSGHWKIGYTCGVEKEVYSLVEDIWTVYQAFRYSTPGCETIDGTSGSPILNPKNKEVVGINTTTNEKGRVCELNNPCEVDRNQNIFYQQGLNYGLKLYWLYQCLNDSYELDVNIDGCPIQNLDLL